MKEKSFKRAKAMAELSTYKKHPMGCVVTYKNKVISTGYNQDRTDPLQKRFNAERDIPEDSLSKIHAEVHALKHIMDADINWADVEIYTYRKCKSRPFGMARPCKACMKLIKTLGIKNIYYTTDDNSFIHEVIS